jgi:hypothetical protein
MAIQFGKAGKSARDMATKRYQQVYLCAGALLGIALLLMTNLNNMAKLGLPAVIVIVLLVRLVANKVEKKALYTKKRAKDADRGAIAEEKVALRLEDLPESYHGFHDIAFNGFNVDHVIVGPGGVFLVETKSHRGKLEAKDGALLLNGQAPPKDFLKQAWSQTYQLNELLTKETSKEWPIRPVLCFTRAFVGVRAPVKGVEIVRLGYLNQFLTRRSPVLSGEEVERIAGVLRRLMLSPGSPMAR